MPRCWVMPLTSRLDSDYDVTYTVDRATAEGILEDARRFVTRIENYFEENTSGNTD